MPYSLIPRTIAVFAQPAVYAVSARLFVLTTDRLGSSQFKPTVATFYETGLVTSLYEHLLMSPTLAHLDIRHEMPFPGIAGRPKPVDLWLRPANGGFAHCVEAGDFGVRKAHADAAKLRKINPKGSNWFLAFFRGRAEALDPCATLDASFQRANKLNHKIVEFDKHLTSSFKVYCLNGVHDSFGYSLLKII